MRKTTITMLAVASLGLAGCVAVPVHEPVYYGPPAVVVQPSVSLGYSYHSRPHRHHRHHHHYNGRHHYP